MSDVTPPPPPPSQPAAPMPSGGGAPINTWLVPSIIVTVLSICSCFGIIPAVIGLIFAIMSNNKLKAGDLANAASNAKIAKIFTIIAIVLLAIGYIWVIINLVSGRGYYSVG